MKNIKILYVTSFAILVISFLLLSCEQNPKTVDLENSGSKAPEEIGSQFNLYINTPDEDINEGARLAVKALWKGSAKKAGIIVPTVSGEEQYPLWNHPYDNYWINKVSFYFFPRESTEWPIRLFAAYQSPLGEIQGGVYGIPEKDWRAKWEKVPRRKSSGADNWQGVIATPYSEHLSIMEKSPEKIWYGIYVRDHLFVHQVYEQWRATGNVQFLIEMYQACRKSLHYLERYHDIDGNGLIETTAVLSDVVVNKDKDINSTERAEDQVMLYGALMGFAEMSDKLGGKEDGKWARAWAKKLKSGLNSLMWHKDGRYIFGLERESKKPRLGYVTTTYANGYAILFNMTSSEQTEAILSFMDRQEFDVPGPYHIPPVRMEDKPGHARGEYCNGGCGWARGIMPSVTLACFENGRAEQGTDYLKRQAAAAVKAGSFYEYWTWGKYTGETKASGASWYSETSAGYLDALIHGLFGLSSPNPGYKSLRIEPLFPESWNYADLGLHLPSGTRLNLKYKSEKDVLRMQVDMELEIPAEIVLQWKGNNQPKLEGTGILNSEVKQNDEGFQVICWLSGSGEIRLTSKE